jgi:hypothetical protein
MNCEEIKEYILSPRFKKSLLDAIADGDDLETFMKDYLDKDIKKMKKEELELYSFAYSNSKNWDLVGERFKNKPIIPIITVKNNDKINESKSSVITVNNKNEANKQVKNTESKINENSHSLNYQILDNALIVIEFLTETVLSKLNLFKLTLSNSLTFN